MYMPVRHCYCRSRPGILNIFSSAVWALDSNGYPFARCCKEECCLTSLAEIFRALLWHNPRRPHNSAQSLDVRYSLISKQLSPPRHLNFSLILPLSLPPINSGNSHPGRTAGSFFPLWYDSCLHFYLENILDLSSLVQLCLHTLCALSSWPFLYFCKYSSNLTDPCFELQNQHKYDCRVTSKPPERPANTYDCGFVFQESCQDASVSFTTEGTWTPLCFFEDLIRVGNTCIINKWHACRSTICFGTSALAEPCIVHY